ncbi:MAG: 50S ribosomal protein L30 [Nitrospirae bacterium]|nr:50S ribosomal protein L30 [Nitrospirota bacterium]
MATSKQKDEMDTVSITLKRSPIGRSYKQREFLLGLGLRRLHQTVERPKNPQVLGLIDKVKHLVEVI